MSTLWHQLAVMRTHLVFLADARPEVVKSNETV